MALSPIWVRLFGHTHEQKDIALHLAGLWCESSTCLLSHVFFILPLGGANFYIVLLSVSVIQCFAGGC